MSEPSHWDEIDGHPVEDWRYEVENDDTRLGYLDWCRARIENEGGSWPPGDPEPAPEQRNYTVEMAFDMSAYCTEIEVEAPDVETAIEKAWEHPDAFSAWSTETDTACNHRIVAMTDANDEIVAEDVYKEEDSSVRIPAEVLQKIRDIDSDLDERQECPTGDTYNDVFCLLEKYLP